MQASINTGNENFIYRLKLGGYSGVQASINTGNENFIYRLKLGG